MKTTTALLASAALAAAVVGCGSANQSGSASTAQPATTTTSSSKAVNPNAKEKSPPGDIPDSTVFVRSKLPAGGFSVRVPEGWARTGGGAKLTFTSNLNSVTVEKRAASGPLTVAGVKQKDVPALAH